MYKFAKSSGHAGLKITKVLVSKDFKKVMAITEKGKIVASIKEIVLAKKTSGGQTQITDSYIIQTFKDNRWSLVSQNIKSLEEAEEILAHLEKNSPTQVFRIVNSNKKAMAYFKNDYNINQDLFTTYDEAKKFANDVKIPFEDTDEGYGFDIQVETNYGTFDVDDGLEYFEVIYTGKDISEYLPTEIYNDLYMKTCLRAEEEEKSKKEMERYED